MNVGPVKRILIADDEHEILSILQEVWEADPRNECLVAPDRYKALLLARNELLDLMILDVIMPGLTGFEICRTLKQDELTSYIKVIFLTALNQDSDRTMAVTAGADGFLTKPFNLTSLSAEVGRVLYEGPEQQLHLPIGK